ncbi:unnamed protein product [Gongylonema pulchrum]|uniref:G_PROTEIN_RECEP_F1_2 domain-containing protein n=1 Tax=Gongylonema pulchrum TaxID=637853 RepID=A0A183CW52_9BILA|nr:unnamed protein product [Gongylonema pulchrum]
MAEYQNEVTWNAITSTAVGSTSAVLLSTTAASAAHNNGDLRWGAIALSIIMGAISVITVIGNLAVLFSYYIDKNIRQPSNYFIFSLAVSDLVS